MLEQSRLERGEELLSTRGACRADTAPVPGLKVGDNAFGVGKAEIREGFHCAGVDIDTGKDEIALNPALNVIWRPEKL